MIEVDARGFSCPIPVVKTTQALDGHPGKPVIVLVDSEVARENVSRLARSRGYSVKVEQVLDGYRLQLAPAGK
ncbi:sulfurtransferase TusA family protein [Dehalococcoidia bacterium]|nr:sulfurtransferase TusA family protein [Dehalococcoidia bacterium]MCL0073325.1 sulfurtransferase TusA family protein [Dehalococcoidia bacterium]MCL0075351.1 sulfurtransferase TusA family protein [Dehalococcoidia bacterium]MCL0082210.1 sulfurtransferase TusA family protein [Dehalococcoidia bacterium]MCL0084109.1 sulfurtransferase TusA family protein [Dehalococcoidia bacterium]